MQLDKDELQWQERYKSTTPQAICTLYDEFAEVYDKMLYTCTESGHKMVMNRVEDLIPKSSRILDFAACTGLLGVQLHNSGYTNIDALDGSAASLEQCKQKNTYNNMIVEFVGDEKLSIDDDTYDCLVCYGGFAGNHLPISVFSEWIRFVKPGGYIINGMRQRWLTHEPRYNDGKFEAELKRLEQEGKWKMISKEISDDSDPDRVKVIFVFQIC